MNLKGQLKKDRETYRRLTPAQRRLFIWDYYRLPILIAVVVVALSTTLAINLGRTRTALYVVLVNANSEADPAPVAALLAAGDGALDPILVDVEAGYTLHSESLMNTDAQTIEVLAVRFGIGDLDVFAADEKVFEMYAVKDAFVDLSLFIPAELLQANEGDLYRYNNADGQEIVGGLWLREGSALHRAGFYQGDVLIGVAQLAENLDNALLLVQRLLPAA